MFRRLKSVIHRDFSIIRPIMIFAPVLPTIRRLFAFSMTPKLVVSTVCLIVSGRGMILPHLIVRGMMLEHNIDLGYISTHLSKKKQQ